MWKINAKAVDGFVGAHPVDAQIRIGTAAYVIPIAGAPKPQEAAPISQPRHAEDDKMPQGPIWLAGLGAASIVLTAPAYFSN